MLNSKGERMLCYPVIIDAIEPIQGSDNCEAAVIGGWKVMVRKNTFAAGDKVIYFEVDSLLDSQDERFEFLASKKYRIKTQRYTFGGAGLFFSQGLVMALEDFPELGDPEVNTELDDKLNVKYYVAEDNRRKEKAKDSNAKYQSMCARHKELFKRKPFRWLLRRTWGKKLLFLFFGRKKDTPKSWPVGKFPGVSITDQERCENLAWVLQDKTPFIKTEKCDGSSGTYILERKGKKKYEFYVCSRRVRMADKTQESFHGPHNYYWEVAEKYDIENKMKQWLENNPEANWICWQGEVCAPAIQKNPHKLKETHFYCFHWTDSINGRLPITTADIYWREMNMEVVPIIDTEFILPDTMEEFKLQADGMYSPSVCEGNAKCAREGFVYYKTTDPTFSFKNVSREYLLKHE